jgi:mono/diheme cytochrome c family protein
MGCLRAAYDLLTVSFLNLQRVKNVKAVMSSILLIALFAGCSLSAYFGAIENSTAIDPIMIASGRQVYLAQYCGVCHQLSAANTHGTFAPSHDQMGTIASQRIQETNYTGTAQTSAEYIRESLLVPRLYHVPGYETTNHQMPSYEHLSPEDMELLVYLLVNQG